MARFRRGIRQAEAIAAFVRAGGEERPSKRGHALVKMPNGAIVSLPSGVLKTGLLLDQLKIADLTPEQFLNYLNG